MEFIQFRCLTKIDRFLYIAMYNLRDITRPSFRPGFDPPVSSSYIPKVVRPTRKISRDAPIGMRTQTFASDAPIPRIAPDFMRIKQLEAEKEGIKVQLGPGTLTKLIGIKVPDVNNPAIEVDKNVSLAELLTTQKGQLAGIRAILSGFRTDVGASGKLTREQVAQLGVLVRKAFAKDSHLLDRDATMVALTSDRLPSLTLRQMEITRNRVTIDDISDEYYSHFCSYITNSTHIPFENLSPRYPVYGFSGRPVSVGRFRELMKAGHTIDIRKRMMVKKREPLEAKEEKKHEDSEPEPDPRDEDEEESAGLHFGDFDPLPGDVGNDAFEAARRAELRESRRARSDVSRRRPRSSPQKKKKAPKISVSEARKRGRKYKKKKDK